MKYRKLVENAKKPNGFWGKMMIKAMNKGHSSLTSWGLEHMNIERTATVLDIGCGGGKTVDRLCSIVANGKVYGIDYSELGKILRKTQFKKYTLQQSENSSGISIRYAF